MKVTLNGQGMCGSVRAVPSKSAAHRLLICACLAGEKSTIECPVLSRDIEATAACLSALGANIEYDGRFFTVYSPVKRGCRATLDCGESGSTLRFILPVIAAIGADATIKMHGRLPQRPLSPLYGEMQRMGETMSPEGSNPLCISGCLRGGEYTLRADISSQFISGLLFALPLCSSDSTIILTGKTESASYIQMTLDALEVFGIKIKKTENGFYIKGSQKYISPGALTVEGDWSNSAFWLCARAIGAKIDVTGLQSSSTQGDKRIIDIIDSFGTLPRGVKIDVADVPDLVPPLAILAAQAKGETLIYNAGRLRIKESDRIEAVTEMLSSLGVYAEAGEDYIKIRGGALQSGEVSSHNDHRIAMAAAIASIAAGDVTVNGFEAVNKSYPSFLADFKALGGKIISVE